jgi:hypothetical protein
MIQGSYSFDIASLAVPVPACQKSASVSLFIFDAGVGGYMPLPPLVQPMPGQKVYTLAANGTFIPYNRM